MPRLLIDATPILPDGKGVIRYAHQICLQLAQRLPAEWTLQLLITAPGAAVFPPDFRGELILVPQGSEIGMGLFMLPGQVRRLKPEIFLKTNETVGHVRGIPTVTICHDVHEFMVRAQGVGRTFLRRAVDFCKQGLRRRALRNSDIVVCNSEFICRAVDELYGIPAERTAVGYCAVDPRFYEHAACTDRARVLRRYGIDNFILAFATGDPRENYGRYPAVAAKLAEVNVVTCLLVAGIKPGAQHGEELRAEFLRLGLVEGKHFIFEGFLGSERFEDLASLYTAADLYLELSLHEGFGMQLVEAMACGTTCISSPAGALAEIGDKYPLFVDPRNVDDIARKIGKAYAEGLYQRDNREQIQYTKKFSWDGTGAVVANVLQQVAGRRSGVDSTS
jgi:glycosyltransferase involved in cell wall biosynthesis